VKSTARARRVTRKALGRIGVRSTELRFGDPGFIADAAPELEDLGFGVIWLPGGRDDKLFGGLDTLPSVTRRTTIATGVLNVWLHPAQDVGRWWRQLGSERKSRLMLGAGVSHAPTIGSAYAKLLQKMGDYFDQLDADARVEGNRDGANG
jgi:alkanesulfonate monooxygenase SsuD/methylene tetrahydromethanopterin reductase-like flavin-dependent oxidoreductase (luciferase family)